MNAHCPLCNSESLHYIYRNVPQYIDTDIVQCEVCGHLFTIIRKEINVNALYTDEIYKVVENRGSVFDKIIRREYNGVLRQLNKFKKAKGTLLDFGCGKGQFGNLAKQNGWRVKAVETSPDRAAYARNVYGLEVDSAFFTEGSIFDIRFDALTLFHVLEHLPQPGELLSRLVRDNVTDTGVIIVEVPNISSWQSVIAKEKWIHLDVPRHIHHFSSERLQKMFSDIDLKLLKTTYFSFHLGVFGMVDSLIRKLGYKKNIIFELKNNKNKSLFLLMGLVLPFAYIMELFASWFGRGGVIRMYLIQKKGGKDPNQFTFLNQNDPGI
jgi:2-polyprenyl-3-methyl-5-hydroxy-6-metoxy-1,4-benzoquinol methylase